MRLQRLYPAAKLVGWTFVLTCLTAGVTSDDDLGPAAGIVLFVLVVVSISEAIQDVAR